jgi:predicted nucleic acid-binding protein
MAWMCDTNVLVDLIDLDPRWGKWSRRQVQTAYEAEGPIALNPIIYAELAAAFDAQDELDHWLRPALFKRLPLPYEAGFRASRAFLARTSPLPDFYIGAHAEISGFTLVTRDVARYRTYFPKLKLVTPED